VKNITVSIPEEAYRAARIRAAERGTSVSALVGEFLRSLAAQDAEFSRLEALQRDVQATITEFTASDRLSRAELHDRALR
jgi:plasmid stability protein